MPDVDLCVSAGRDENLVRFLLRVFELESSYSVSLATDHRPRLKSASVQLEGLATICHYLALHSKVFSHAQLLGSESREEAAQV